MCPKDMEGSSRTSLTVELVIVVVIVGFLAALAIPMYGRHIERARLEEATSHLAEIVDDAREWAMTHPDAEGRPLWPSDAALDLDLGETMRFTYAIVDGGGRNASTQALVVEATGHKGGRMRGVTVTVSVPDLASPRGRPVVTKP